MNQNKQQKFRQVLGRFATGITVITCRTPDGELGGATVNSFASLSLNPPLVLWSIDKTSDQFAAFAQATHYAVNILSEDQQALSDHFAKPSTDKYNGLAYTHGLGGAPLFGDDICASLECRIDQRIEGGDHMILIGEVLQVCDYDKRPLLFFGGGYTTLIK